MYQQERMPEVTSSVCQRTARPYPRSRQQHLRPDVICSVCQKSFATCARGHLQRVPGDSMYQEERMPEVTIVVRL